MRAGLALLVLAGCPKATPGGAAAAKGPMPTQSAFAWPDGAVGVRSAERFTARQVDEQRQEMRLRTTERMAASRHDDGWILHSDQGEFLDVGGQKPDPALAALAGVPLDAWISEGGASIELSDPEGWAEAARQAMYAVLPQDDPMAFVQVDLSVQPLQAEATMQREWQLLVGFWSGRPTVAGPLGTVEGFDALGAASAGSVRLECMGADACVEGGPADCVRYAAESDPDPAMNEKRAAPLLRAWVEALPEPPQSSGVDDLKGTLRALVVLDPRTMLPWRYSTAERLQGTLRVDDETLPFSSEQGKTVTWTWTVPEVR